jgi:PAS domain S-box-containing protein
LGAIVNTAVDAILIVDERGLVESANPAAVQQFGYRSDEMRGRNVQILIPSMSQAKDGGSMERYLRAGEEQTVGSGHEAQAKRKDGSLFPVDFAVSAFRDQSRRMFTVVIRDVTIRKQLEREVLEVATAEQQRIGQALHDSTGQELTALCLLVHTLTDVIETEPSLAALLTSKVRAGLERALAQVRAHARGLIPVEVDAGGLAAALSELTARTSDMSGVKCSFSCKGSVSVSKHATATHLYHLAQEAVANALRHGRAQHVSVSLKSSKNSLTLRVSDDGVGFPSEPMEGKGLGLKIMSYRAGLIGAELTIGPAETGGTLVTCFLPRT